MNRPRLTPRRTKDGMADSRRMSERGGGSDSATSARVMDMISLAVDQLSPPGQAAATEELRPPAGQAPRNGAPNKAPPGDEGLPQRVERPLLPAGVGADIDRVPFRGPSQGESVKTKQQALSFDITKPRKGGSVPKKTVLDDDDSGGLFTRKDETVDAILQIMKRFVHPASQNKSVHLKLYTVAQIVESRLSRAGDRSSPPRSGPALEQSVKAIVAQIYEAVSSRTSGGSRGQKRRRTDEISQGTTVRKTPVPRSLDKAERKPKRICSCLIDVDARLDKSSPIRFHPATEMANIRRVLPPQSGREILRRAAASLSPPVSPEPESRAAGHERDQLPHLIARGGVLDDVLSHVMEPGKCLNGLQTSFHAEAVRNARRLEAAGAVATCSGEGQLDVCAERLQGALAQSARTSLGAVMVSRDLGERLDAGGAGPPKQSSTPPGIGRGDGEKSGGAPKHPSQLGMLPLPPPQRRSFVPRFA